MKRRVLIVEDGDDARQIFHTLLGLWGWEVDEARDGPEAVTKALKQHPDVAVVDICLPGFDGYEVARRVKAALHGRIRLIALTVHDDPDDRRKADAAGFDHFVTKPADPQTFARLLGPA
jgi:CheY-like chemotaxis protein